MEMEEAFNNVSDKAAQTALQTFWEILKEDKR